MSPVTIEANMYRYRTMSFELVAIAQIILGLRHKGNAF